ncbi:leucine zipper putative tumor suppressor 2 homolog isoform X1 [Oncorhynchus kisutch]|uniref:Leucine zipper putative tumor suppressor 2 homolog n=2 Tax=Oncorhynchus kisutch TaxID=8019 RepID=A0A8C7K8S7_ONCKI|nr:leucine zipper putative tumor suppressor 2 homolog isoform X1 [Oncorhynchus kisutch]
MRDQWTWLLIRVCWVYVWCCPGNMALVQTLPVSVTDHPKPPTSLHIVTLSPVVGGPCGPFVPGATMGSVSSLISGRTHQEQRHCRATREFSTKPRRNTPTTNCFKLQGDSNTLPSGSSLEQLLIINNQTQLQPTKLQPPPLPTKKQPRAGKSAGGAGCVAGGGGGSGGNGNYGFVREEVNDNHVVTVGSPCSDSEEQRNNRGLNGNISGPPPKLIPVSGKLEKNMEKILIRPTAFKPVFPKNRHSVQYLSPRPGGNLSESQGSLNLLLPLSINGNNGNTVVNNVNTVFNNVVNGTGSYGNVVPLVGSSSSSDSKRNSYSGGRNARNSHSCSMSDSGRNSLSSLPTHSSNGYSLANSEASGSGSGSEGSRVGPDPGRTTTTNGGSEINGGQAHSTSHGHSNSDSGRSSSSKSTGSLSGRGQPLSDSGSCGRSPPTVEGYEGVVRELEEKLRERDLELHQLRENLDENEAAICQVYEEKQLRCERELEELRQSCSSEMKQASQKAQRVQQALQLQVFQLQQEKKKLQEDFSSLLQDREELERRCASIQREQTQLGPRLEETKWEVCQKSGEISLLKQQLKESQSELSQKGGELVVLKSQLREVRSDLQNCQATTQEAGSALRTRSLELEVCENELQRRKSEAELLREKVGRLEEELAHLRDALANQGGGYIPGGQAPATKGQCMSLPLPQGRGGVRGGRGGLCPSVGYREVEEGRLGWGGESDETKAQRQSAEAVLGLRQQVERLRAELMYERRSSEEQLGGFEEERKVWQEEKEKVIRYQKQLQQNYIQMYRRNRDLERVMRELSLELENRDVEDYDVHSGSNDIHFEEIAATEI